MMEDFLRDVYTMDEIREATGEKNYGEEVPMVQPLVGQSDVPKNSHGHVHSPPRIYLPVIECERNTMLLTPQ
jgi:hypothetical protein